ncbi:conserved hypothetical protein [Ricinus communis]|uniref:Fe2OG dioxygenase domain-containing protein n=1 Tax=Ricinus communis TaxID=3988 RepID=B9RQA0_RICCO|nr:conserved hypothetical protein [Ricinus communis]
MSSETALSLPVIDFSSTELKPGTPVWETVKSQVRKAAEEYGCFEALVKNVPQELRKAMDAALEELFALPLEIKKLHLSDIPYHGYIGPSPSLPNHESIGFEAADNFDNVQSFTNILWPHGNLNFRFVILTSLWLIDGLEVQTKDGEWFNVKFSPHSFIVLIGESLSAWTNGRLHSPYHRVMIGGNKTRYSAILFAIPKEGYIVKAVEELVGEEH